MQQVIFLVLAAAIGLVIFKVRGDAAKQRKAVMARLASEREERGGVDYSPTAELFREVGVNHDPEAPLPRNVSFPEPDRATRVPEFPSAADGAPVFERLSDLADPDAPVTVAADAVVAEPVAAEPEPEPEPDSTGDLRTLFQGISMPAGLRPLGPLVPVSASFVTAAAPAEVHAGLDAEFARLACDARWVEPTVAQTERNGMRGLVTIYPNPTAALDLEGNPLFPGVEPGHVVVRMLAL